MTTRMAAAVLVIVVAGVAFVGSGSASPTAKARTATTFTVSPHFYSQNVHFDVHYRIWAPPGACVKDQYGGDVHNDYACTQFEQNNADWDIRIWQTTPSWSLLHSERELGIEGHGSVDVFYSLDLGLPYSCYGQHFRRNYKAVFRVFSPLTSSALATKSYSFYVGCN